MLHAICALNAHECSRDCDWPLRPISKFNCKCESLPTFHQIFIEKDFIFSSSGSNMSISGGTFKIINLRVDCLILWNQFRSIHALCWTSCHRKDSPWPIGSFASISTFLALCPYRSFWRTLYSSQTPLRGGSGAIRRVKLVRKDIEKKKQTLEWTEDDM